LAVFIGLFALGLASSLAYVWLRPALYQSTASLLTVAPEEAGAGEGAVHRVEGQGPGRPPSITLAEPARPAGGTEHVSLQRQLLLGVPLFEEALRRLYQQPEWAGAPRLGVEDLRRLLGVDMVADTNLVTLKAQGPQPKILAPLVNAWIDAYQALREQTTLAAANNTRVNLEEEARQLDRKVEAKREALERFRSVHGILAKSDADNTPMLRLKGLNEALNKAIDEQVKAKAKLDAIRAALARGEPVMPPEEAPGLEHLEKRAQELREMQKDLQRRYTPAYLAMHPQLKQIPGQLAQVEEEIRSKAESGSQAMLGQAGQAEAGARQAVADLRQQIDALKRESSEFSNRFAEQEAMQADLARLEEMRRETQAKLAQAETRPKEVYPPLQVVERAYPPAGAVWPHYWRDSGIALAASLLFALAGVWLYEFLARAEETPAPAPAPAPMPSFQFYSVQGGLPPTRPEDEAPALPLQQDVPFALESPFPRELAEHEIHVLLEAADNVAQRWIGLLLSGLSAKEAAALRAENLDLTADRILVVGERPRTLPLAPRLKAILAQPTGLSAADVDAEEVDARIRCAAFDSGLSNPDALDAAALRHTYIAHLVRLGIRLSDLERVVGRLPARQLANYGRLSPPGPGLPAGQVPLIHPALGGG
jgi:uncharacterized protein involved in exopolysaccharide biosynthesis